jgi:hypothetical protein
LFSWKKVLYGNISSDNKESMDGIIKECQLSKKNCLNVSYNKLVTSTNNPRQSNAMRYSQLLRSSRTRRITQEEYIELFGPLTIPPVPPTQNNKLFMTFFY